MDIEEYRKSYLDELRFSAEYEGTETEYQFINKMLADLEEIGELNDPTPFSVEIKGRRGRMMSFDAYAYDEADGALVLISSEFINERDANVTLTNSRINEICQRMENFIDECVNGELQNYCDDSDPVLVVAKEIRNKIGKGMLTTEITRFKYVIISNASLSKQVKNVSRLDFLERPVDLNVWPLERIFQTFANNDSEVIEIETSDFGCAGIQCLKADLGDGVDYDAYLGIVPGRFLGDIYLKYGSKLLQGNIRAFLSIRGNVNKGIRGTIIDHPSSFFTFNNGIAIVARSVRFSEDGTRITHFVDPQIINGGQTTASLANAIIKKEAKNGMDTIFVPMKLTVLNVEDNMTEEQIEQYNEITKTISQCANSQNSVSNADFFSNHPFHIALEKLSRKVMAPPVSGCPYQTIWFYERSRGKWEQEQFKLSAQQKKKFCETHPKSQVIKKEKLAKCLNAVYQNPHQVCQSSAINFSRFATIVERIYEESRDSINDEFFRKGVCAVILFDSLDKAVNKAEWYPKGGDKAQIVPYAIAKLMSLIPNGKDIDWRTIWQKQSLYPVLEQELLEIAHFTQDFFKKEAQGGLVRSMSRREGTWKKFKDARYELSLQFIEKLVSAEEAKSDAASAKKEHKFNADIDASIEIFKFGKDYWLKVYSDLEKERVVSAGDLEFIKSIANYIGRNSLLYPAQCKRLIKIISKAEDKGYIMP